MHLLAEAERSGGRKIAQHKDGERNGMRPAGGVHVIERGAKGQTREENVHDEKERRTPLECVASPTPPPHRGQSDLIERLDTRRNAKVAAVREESRHDAVAVVVVVVVACHERLHSHLMPPLAVYQSNSNNTQTKRSSLVTRRCRTRSQSSARRVGPWRPVSR